MLMQMRHDHPQMQLTHMLPYGAVIHDGGVQFVVFSRDATKVRLLLYRDVNDLEPEDVIHFDPNTDRWGDIWSVFVPGIGAGQLYHFQASGPHNPSQGLWFDPSARLIDPFAKALAGTFQESNDGVTRPPKCVVMDEYFDWEGDRHLRHETSDSIIYEMHVKGFTKHESSGVEHPGTYLGVIEKIPYLKSLGVTAVELMPVHEFPIMDVFGKKPNTPNYWGYDPLAFFAPHRGYASSDKPGAQVHEFKQMVKALHASGIEVILDVVFNHTCEGNDQGPLLSFKGLANSVYYMLESDKRFYKNYSGCGNTINGNHPIVREMIFHCLRHWVHNYHVDGFRFDLASILSRDRGGNLVPNPPLVEAIGEDPLLADTKIIAEAWDAAGAYQVGSFGGDRWAEWNGRYRDDVRRYWRGDAGLRGMMATRLSGSADLYQPGGRPPCCSINFVTSHDGFTMNDLVSYTEKHNMANGEKNRDGDNNNHSENFGHEGPSDDPIVESFRTRQIKNFLTTLMMSQGVPMLVAGDEFRRTQQGNNNAYCQDNEISWIDWELVNKNEEFVHFCQKLIAFRKSQPTVRRHQFLTGSPISAEGIPDVSWFSHLGTAIDWQSHEMAMICLLAAPPTTEDPLKTGRDVLILMNSGQKDLDFLIPAISKHKIWRLFVDTGAPAPDDIFEKDGPLLPTVGKRRIFSRSMAVYVAEK